jgi:C_GCAxxG_C_C family probable redox protein
MSNPSAPAGCDHGPASQARAYFTSGFNCAEAVFMTGAAALGPGCACIPAVATPFGGGLAHTDGACGALTGALMAIGLAAGHLRADDQAGKALAGKLSHDFVISFKLAFGHLTCPELTGYRFSIPRELEAWRQSGARERVCAPMVARTADLLVFFLKEKGLLDREKGTLDGR